MIDAINADSNIPTKNDLIVPNLSGAWTPESVWDTGFITAYASSIGILSVEQSVTSNSTLTIN